MHALVHDAYSTVLISTFCGDALSISLYSCSRSRSRLGLAAHSVNSFSGVPSMRDVQAEVLTQISVSVS